MEPPLFHIDDGRYQSMRLIPWWSQSILAKAKVLVIGAGALGNEVLKNLMLLGVGNVTIVDRDRVETSNLNRSILFQAEDVGAWKAEVVARQVSRSNPDTHVEPIVGDVLYDVGLGRFANSDLVLGCVDNREARLWINRCCWRTSRPWIDAGLRELSGVIQPFHPLHGPCYECGMKESDYQSLAAAQSCHGIAQEKETAGRIPTSPTIAALIAGIQSQWAVKSLHGKSIPWGTATIWNGDTDQFYRSQLPQRDDCLSHERWTVDLAMPKHLQHQPLSQTFAWLRQETGYPPTDPSSAWYLQMERMMWHGWHCGQCHSDSRLALPVRRLHAVDGTCPSCDSLRQGIPLNQVDEASPLADMPLKALGIPNHDWLRFVCPISHANPVTLVRTISTSE